MNELLDLTGKLDASTESTLKIVNEVTSDLDIPYLIIGATARDMVLHYGYNTPVRRATTDIDFAFQVESWEHFSTVKERLIKSGFTSTHTQHRLISPYNISIDIVPFGGVEQVNANIAWPPNGEIVMSVRGFLEAIDNAQLVVISKDPDVHCPVVSPEGLMLLKLISWNERPRELRRKDANDIHYLLTTYYDIKNIKEDIYSEENIADLERYQWDQKLAACSLMGKSCCKIVSDITHAEILTLYASNNIERIAVEMNERTAGTNLNLLTAFMDGFNIRA